MVRALIACFLLFVVLEGAIRKWFLPELSNVVFVTKDVMLAGAFVAFILSGRQKLPRSQDLAL
jgi:hypothetical protein